MASYDRSAPVIAHHGRTVPVRRPVRPRLGAPIGTLATARLTTVLLVVLVALAVPTLLVPGIYEDPPVTVGNIRGTALVLLVVGGPALWLSATLARRGSVRAAVVWAGLLAYVAYNGVLFCFGAVFNRLFALDVAVLAVPVWILLLLYPHLRALRTRNTAPTWRRRAIAVYLTGSVLMFAVIWLLDITPAIVGGGMPAGLAGLKMINNPVEVLDFAFTVPAAAVAGVALWRDRRFGDLLAGLLLAMLTIESLGVAVDQFWGHVADPAASAAAVPAFGVLAVAGAAVTVVHLRSIVPQRNGSAL